MELRIVDPRSLRENPDNSRRTPASPEADAMLQASVAAVGIIQPPGVRPDEDGGLVIVFGHRRVRAAIAAGLPEIHVLLTEHGDGADVMRALAENIVRASLNPVDQWRAVERLVALNWTDDSIALALALPVRQVRKLRLLARIHPAMLDQMAKGDMPDEPQLRTIAAATAEEQTQVWKKHKPKKAQPRVAWWEVARALSKRRIEAKHARFDDKLARAYGIVWQEDLFAPAGEDGRYTTDVDAFFGAQQEWLAKNLPERGVLLEIDQYGQPKLPPKAQRVYGKPGRGDSSGWYVDPLTGEVASIAFRMPEPKTRRDASGTSGDGATDSEAGGTPTRTRPDITHKGIEMIGDLRTDALHEALQKAPISDDALLALLVLGYAGNNVSVATGNGDNPYGRGRCEEIAAGLIADGQVTTDRDALVRAAREMLIEVLCCREGRSNSGVVARLAGVAIGADDYLPNMATEEFLSCLSKPALTRALDGTPVLPRSTAKETRRNLVDHFVTDGRFVHPAARFQPSAEKLEAHRSRYVRAAEPADEEEAGETDGVVDEGDAETVFEDDYPAAAE
jgi:ParB/RepB/Spo0J family partition protein